VSVTEHERHQLYTWFEEHMGTERADILMNLLPPVGWGDVSTRRDLTEFQAATRRDLAEFRTTTRRDLAEFQTATRRDLAELQTATKHDLAELEARMDVKLATLKSELLRTFGTWLFASQAAVIAAMAVFFAVD
jgi:hypothetical protein